METSMADYQEKQSIRSAWDFIQVEFSCCGARNKTEWFKLLKENNVPDSCCKKTSEGCGQVKNNDWKNIYQEPCLIALQEMIEDNLINLIVAGVVVAVARPLALCS